MSTEKKFFLATITVGVYAMVMFTAAGFFYDGYRELIDKCGRFSYADCYANDAIVVSSLSLRAGTAVFALLGAVSWMVASYLGLRWAKLRGSVRLP
ncbi:MAG TPA: hypothetical protein PLP21_09880 [Pyrinomonadaceae bacterium]|nr:hypothetical protein [Acidobacteriota bacterium]HQZ96617.1 hypothetical protein [Pyrinomonadaceae bacterium]